MTLSEELTWRGFVHQTTFKDIKDLDKEKRTFYHGFDASADSQTIGNLAAMILDGIFIKHGYRALILAGGATSLIGDPGGKLSERDVQAEERIAGNVRNAQEELQKILSGKDFKMVNNIEWTKDLKVLDFLREIGKNFSIGDLIKKDFIASRIGEGSGGISYAEFSYTLLQGMDYLHLFDTEGATLQIGGSDQWGNCISGVDLIRKARGKEAHVFAHILVIDKATGRKFGKSESGAIWLSAKKTSVFKFYQFWLNLDDKGVGDYIKIYTEIEPNEFDKLITEFEKDRSSRSAQKFLAYECTKIVHGEEAAKRAKKITEVLFDGRNVAELSEVEFNELAQELPNSKQDDLVAFIVETGLADSKGAARRLIEQGAIEINGKKATSESKFNTDSLVKKGKNSFAVKL
ncbi:MAG: tyrosyl-tRNA synthetase [Patescibacteria group bacterium]|nr:tyrosyl-tRNA synthetase [Patescibacteria group bacterium]